MPSDAQSVRPGIDLQVDLYESGHSLRSALGRFQPFTILQSQIFLSIYHLSKHAPVCLHLHEVDMSLICPSCGSQHVITLDYGRKTGSAIGATAGAAGAAAAALGGAGTGATMGRAVGPAGSLFGGIAGVLIGALIGGASGGAAGAAFGEHVDENLLENCKCQKCGHRFSKRHLTK